VTTKASVVGIRLVAVLRAMYARRRGRSIAQPRCHDSRGAPELVARGVAASQDSARPQRGKEIFL
jgi:hypothetical protein